MAAPLILTPKSSRQSKMECKITAVQKEVLPKIEKIDPSGNYPSPESIAEGGWRITPPPWLNPNVIADIVTLKSQIEKDHAMLLDHEKIITLLLNERGEMRKEIQELKLQLSQKQQVENLWKESDASADLLERVFNTRDIKIKNAKEALSGLGARLKYCKKDGIDSVTLVRSVRGE